MESFFSTSLVNVFASTNWSISLLYANAGASYGLSSTSDSFLGHFFLKIKSFIFLGAWNPNR
jgi:hypothetical protein